MGTQCPIKKAYCPKSCGLCKGMTPHPSMKCPDLWPYCPRMMEEGQCNRDVYRKDCCQSCKANPDETEEEKKQRLCRVDNDKVEWCKDKKEKCFQYGKMCPGTCGLCEGMTPAPSNTCYDVYSTATCSRYCNKTHSQWVEFVKKNCRKTCGLC